MQVKKLSELHELSLYIPLDALNKKDYQDSDLEDLPIFIKGSIDASIYSLERIVINGQENFKVRSLDGIPYLHSTQREVIHLDFKSDHYIFALHITNADKFKQLLSNFTKGA